MAGIDQPSKTGSSAPAATADAVKSIFISYASQDIVAANKLCAALEAAGLPCWIAPRDVRPGEPYAAAIVEAINACRLLVLVLTKNAIDSRHVLREVERASSKNRSVLSIRLDAAELPPELEYFLSANHWLDASGGTLESVLPALIVSGMMLGALCPAAWAEQFPHRPVKLIVPFAAGGAAIARASANGSKHMDRLDLFVQRVKVHRRAPRA